tara:strand:+ start:1806 stop:1964 length:159 start_codon:yes stop_codon:yes gene_type:complete
MNPKTRSLLEEAKMMLYGVALMSQKNLLVNHVNVMRIVDKLEKALEKDGVVT